MRDYHERLTVPAAWWILAVPVIVLLGAYGIYANLSGATVVIIYAVFTVGGAAVLLVWGSGLIEVGDGELRAAGAVLPLLQVTEVRALDARQAEAMRGPRADPAAHTLIRPYLKTAVYVAVRDPAAQVPYWLIGTRRPGRAGAPRSSGAARRVLPRLLTAGRAEAGIGGPKTGSAGRGKSSAGLPGPAGRRRRRAARGMIRQ